MSTEEEKEEVEQKAEEINVEEKRKKDKEEENEDAVVEDDEKEEDGGMGKPFYPKKPDPDARSGREHWKECMSSGELLFPVKIALMIDEACQKTITLAHIQK